MTAGRRPTPRGSTTHGRGGPSALGDQVGNPMFGGDVSCGRDRRRASMGVPRPVRGAASTGRHCCSGTGWSHTPSFDRCAPRRTGPAAHPGEMVPSVCCRSSGGPVDAGVTDVAVCLGHARHSFLSSVSSLEAFGSAASCSRAPASQAEWSGSGMAPTARDCRYGPAATRRPGRSHDRKVGGRVEPPRRCSAVGQGRF